MSTPAALAPVPSIDPLSDELGSEILWALDRYLSRHLEELDELLGPRLLAAIEAPEVTTEQREALWSALAREIIRLQPSPGLEPHLQRLQIAIDGWLEAAEGRIESPSLDVVRDLVAHLGRWIADLNQGARLPQSESDLLRQVVLQASFPVAELCFGRRTDLAARYLFREWQTVSASLGVGRPGAEEIEELLPAARYAGQRFRVIEPPDHRLLWFFQTSVLEFLRNEQALQESLVTLIDFKTALGLDSGEVGKVFGVSGEEVAGWETGELAIPQAVTATLSDVQECLRRLRAMFLPERLPQVIRRPAELFEGEPALGWILRGRLRDVTDRYDLLLQYQA